MARPGMTDGTSADAAPEVDDPRLDPGRNVATDQFAAAPPEPAAPLQPGERPPQAVIDEAQAEARRDASPASYQQPEVVESKKPGNGLLLIGCAVAVVVAALWIFIR